MSSRINSWTTRVRSSLPGKAAKQDYEYRRCGTCSIFVAVEPKGGKRFVQARRHRKRADSARFVRELLQRYPKARRIHSVLDNLNTHNEKSLIETFDATKAKQLLRRIVWHYTPKHASSGKLNLWRTRFASSRVMS